MRHVYWRPPSAALKMLGLFAVLAILALIAEETFLVKEKQPYYAEKIKAAKLAERAFHAVKMERVHRGLPIDAEADPANTGLIGDLLTPVTTNPGQLQAKQTSLNPNFAAVVVHLLKRAHIEPGDVVAVGLSGSFPAINICTLAAIEVAGAHPLIVTSAGSSQWGANLPGFMWPEMEKLLVDQRLLHTRSLALTRGGIDDRALGLPKDSRRLLDDAMVRTGLPVLEVENFTDSVDKRMALFREKAGERPIKAYINVGGGTTSVGTKVGKNLFKPGLNLDIPRGAGAIDSVMTRFSLQGVPIIHLTQIVELAHEYGLPEQPTHVPAVGEGKMFVREGHNRVLAGVLLIALLVALALFSRLSGGSRSFPRKPPSSNP